MYPMSAKWQGGADDRFRRWTNGGTDFRSHSLVPAPRPSVVGGFWSSLPPLLHFWKVTYMASVSFHDKVNVIYIAHMLPNSWVKSLPPNIKSAFLNHRFFFFWRRFAVVKAPLKQTFHRYMHLLSTLAAIAIATAATVISFLHFIGSPWGPLLGIHSLLGLASLFLMILGVVNGAMCRPVDLGSNARRMWARSHLVLGVCLVVCATSAAVLGFQKFQEMSGKSIIVRTYEVTA